MRRRRWNQSGVDSSDLVALIDANEAAIEAAGVVEHSYTASGREHGILDFGRFYEIEDEARRHKEWLIRERRITIRAMILTQAVCIAPFLALVFGITAALTVLGVGLLFTACLCWSGPNHGGVVALEAAEGPAA
jgi:hypothetical protein